MEIRESEKAGAGYRTVRRIGLAHGIGVVIYALVAALSFSGKFALSPVAADLNLLRATFVALALGIFWGVGRLREYLLAPELATVEQALVPGARLQRMIAINGVVFAACDLVAVLGLILFFVGGAQQDVYGFVVLSLLFLSIRFPRQRQWHAWYGARIQRR